MEFTIELYIGLNSTFDCNWVQTIVQNPIQYFDKLILVVTSKVKYKNFKFQCYHVTLC